MKTDFDIKVHVELGVTPELTQLVKSILGQPVVTEEPKAPAVEELLAEPEQLVDEQPKPERKRRSRKAEQPAEAPAEEQPAETQEVQEEAPAQEPKPEAKKDLTEQDVREAMERTRKRIEGEDYKDNTESEGHKKYHRQLTSMFKNIAAELGKEYGVEKPSALPAEQRQAFITECDLLQVMEDDTIGKPETF